MDDDSCLMEFMKIIPLDSERNCSESAEVKLSPCHAKVCVLCMLRLCVIIKMVYFGVVTLECFDTVCRVADRASHLKT